MFFLKDRDPKLFAFFTSTSTIAAMMDPFPLSLIRIPADEKSRIYLNLAYSHPYLGA